MRESVPTARYSPVCNVLRQWKTSLILTYRVYRLYDTINYTCITSSAVVKRFVWYFSVIITLQICGMFTHNTVLYMVSMAMLCAGFLEDMVWKCLIPQWRFDPYSAVRSKRCDCV